MTSKEYSELKKEIDDLKGSLEEQNVVLKKIHQAIVGDKEFGQDGLVTMVKNHEKWIASQKYIWAKIYGGIAVGSTIGTIILNFLYNRYYK